MTRRLCLALAVSLALAAIAAAIDYPEMAKRFPENVNTIGLIDLGALNNSELGKALGWALKPELTNLPETVGKLAVAGRFNPAAGHQWQYGVAELNRDVSAEEIARRRKGTVTTVGSRQAVMTPQHMAIIELGKRLVGIMMTTNRQEIRRWVDIGDAASTMSVNPYLRDFIKETSAAQLRFGLDTADLFDPQGVRRALAALPAMADKKDQVEAIASHISNMKGVNFGSLRVDFDSDVSSLSGMAADLIKDVLQEQGLWLSDFDSWKADVRGKTIYFSGKMTEAGLRQAMTILLSVEQSMHSIAETTPTDTPASISKRYFNGVTNLVDDLRRQMRSLRSTREFAYWYEHTARKIDQLPSVGVDPDLLNFGGTMSDKFRAMGASCRGQSIDVNNLVSYRRSGTTVSGSAGVGAAWGYGFGYATGGVWFNNNYADVAQQMSDTVAQASRDRVRIWESIDQYTGEIRRTLSQRFGVEF
jgi:hypothetical protein